MPPLSNPRHEKFSQHYAFKGGNATDSYRAGYGSKRSDATAASIGSRLLKNVQICARIAELQQKTANGAVLSAIERREFLARVVRADIAAIDLGKDGDLVQEKTTRIDETGAEIVKIKLPGKRECIMADAELAGDVQALGRGVQVNVGVHVTQVSAEELSTIAERKQRILTRLKERSV